jgi:hypothetical protein
MPTVVRIQNLGPGKIKVLRTSTKPYQPHRELVILKAGEASEFECENIADLLVEET